VTTAFVLSGGGSLGSVQVGMLRALADAGIRPDFYVGSSVGALNAAFLGGHQGREGVEGLGEVWRSLRRNTVFPMSIARVGRAVAGRGQSLADPRPLRALVAKRLGYERLEQAAVPVSVVATEVLTGREVVLSAGSATDAVMASAALPGVFPPVAVDDHLLMDGGVANNTPISVARSLGADCIYVLPTGYACALASAPSSALGMALHAVTLTIQRRLISDVEATYQEVDLRVAPPLCPLAVSPVDFRQTAQLIDRAQAATRRWLESDSVRSNPAEHLALHEHPPEERG
jgi:NTE family protein